MSVSEPSIPARVLVPFPNALPGGFPMTIHQCFLVASVTWLLMVPCQADEPEPVPRTVGGVIESSDGTPASGIKIQLYTIKDRSQNSPTHETHGQPIVVEKFETEGETDAAGKFRLDFATAASGGFMRLTHKNGPTVSKGFHFFMTPKEQPAPWSKWRFQLSEYKAVQYRVVDADGHPITGAVVHRMSGGPLNLGPKMIRFIPTDALKIGETNEKGFVDDYAEKETSQFVWVTKEGYLTQYICVGPPDQPSSSLGGTSGFTSTDDRLVGQDEVFNIVLHPCSRIEGRVIDPETRLPVSDANVVVELQFGGAQREKWLKGSLPQLVVRTTTGDEGQFSVTGFPATKLKVYVWNDEKFAGRNFEHLDAPQPNSLGDIELGDGEVISGRVWDADTQLPAAIQNGFARVRTFMGTEFEGAVQDDGRFEIRVPTFFEGTASLAPHPLWSEHSAGGPNSSPTRPAKLEVRSRPAPLSNEEISTELAHFPQDYHLPDNEVTRRINRPFSRSREAYFQCDQLTEFTLPAWRIEPALGHMRAHGSASPTSPNGAVYVVDKQGRYRIAMSTHGQLKIGEILRSACPSLSHNRMSQKFKPGQSDPVLGDFVIREGASLEEVVRGLNAAFEQAPQIPIHLSLSEQNFLAAIIKNRPESGKFSEEMQLRLIPEGYEGPIETRHLQGTWGHMLNQIVEYQLGLEWTLECEETPDSGRFVFEMPQQVRSDGVQSPEQNRAAHQANLDLQIELRKIAPAAFKEYLGVEMEIKETPLPVVTIE